jgi:hypothetical protein
VAAEGGKVTPHADSRARPRPLDDDAVAYLGVVPPRAGELLRRVWRDTERHLCAGAQREIHWINLWQRSDPADALAVDGVEQLSTWSRELAAIHYAGEDAEFDGFGFIVNPVGSATQLWHIDYAHDYSTIFVPLTALTPQNAMQYLVLPRSLPPAVLARATADRDRVDFQEIVAHADYVSVRQLVTRPFAMFRLDFGVVHRGIANTEKSPRIMFWLSVKKRGALLPAEPAVAVVHERFRLLPSD